MIFADDNLVSDFISYEYDFSILERKFKDWDAQYGHVQFMNKSSYIEAGMENENDKLPAAPTSTASAPASHNSTSTFGGRGLSLQIVNPDTLTDENSRNMKKRSIPQSPITPWDGQLEALVSHVKQQEALSPSHDEAQSRKVSEENADGKQSAEETTAQQLPLPLRGPHSILQSAICKGSVDEVSQICSQLAASSSTAMLNERNEAGYHPFHSAAALGFLGGFGSNSDIALNICQVLISILPCRRRTNSIWFCL